MRAVRFVDRKHDPEVVQEVADVPDPDPEPGPGPVREGAVPGTLDEIAYDECLELLRFGDVGRIALSLEGGPTIVPVNYRLLQTPGCTWIVLRTRPGNLLDRDGVPAAFEIDHVDRSRSEGWSVLVRGTLLYVDPDAADVRARFDPRPWVTDERDRWLVLEPFSITGRRLHTTAPDQAAPDLFFG